jgi:hypothetical protein
MRDVVRWVVLCCSSLHQEEVTVENTQGSLQSRISVSNSGKQHGEVPLWFDVDLITVLPFMAKLLQGSTWTDGIIRCIPWSRFYFRTTIHFFKRTMCPIHTARTVLSWSEELKMDLIFPGQHSHHIWTSLQTSQKQREDILQEGSYRILLGSVQNLY